MKSRAKTAGRSKRVLFPAGRVCFLVLLGSFTFHLRTVRAQEYPSREIDLDAFVQELFAVQEEEVNYEDLYESLFQLYTQPLNLNDASREELYALYVLSEAQVNHFIRYRTQNGPLLTIYELQAIPGFDLRTIYQLLPFVRVKFAPSPGRSLWQKIREEPNHYFLLRYGRTLEKQKGYTSPDTSAQGVLSSRYQGSPDRWYARYRVSHARDFSFGFTLEKDAGEQLTWDPATRRYGADFFSFHAQLQNRGRWRNLVLGDFQMQIGQGLVSAAGFSPGKGAETITTTRRSTLGIRPYTSVLESGFFRGAAASYELKPQWLLTGFYSLTHRDARLLSSPDSLDTDTAGDYINSLQTSGLHRTALEIGAKGKVRVQDLGGNLLFLSRSRNMQLGFTFMQTNLDARLERKPLPYNRFEFSGTTNQVFGLHYTYNWRNFNLFGEWARSRSGGVGGLSGLMASLSPQIDMALLYRRFDRHFHSFYANAFSENTRSINEEGLYWGIKISPIRQLTCNAYYDRFSFPWLRYRVDAPSDGYEYLMRLAYRPAKTTVLYLQFREEQKGKNLSESAVQLASVVPSRRRNYTISVAYDATRSISLHTRLQLSDDRKKGRGLTKGMALVQDISLEWRRFKLSTRFALFDTDDYNNRQYVYEKDVLYSFSIPAYYNRGFRNYFLLQIQINRKVDFWVRWAQTNLRDSDTFGSGLEQIAAPRKTDLRLQVRYKF
jgi:hypothetical protein